MSAGRGKHPRISTIMLARCVLMIGLANYQPVASADETGRLEMWEEPSHQLVFVDGPARVLDIRIAPGVTSEFHRHRFATTYVVIQDALVASQLWDAEWSASGPREFREAGATVDSSSYVADPYYHRVRSEDRRTFHLVAIINERPAAGDPKSIGHAGNGGSVDNRWFREHRLRVAGGADSGTQKFASDVVLIQPIAGLSHIIEKGVAHSFKSAPAAFSWHPAGTEFRIANRSRDDLDFVLIEVKP